ncbi:MAG: SLC13 family permease [Opitutales bacterium]
MTVAIGLVFAVLGIAFVLFATGWIRPDVTAMLALLALVVTGTIAPEEAFEGFSSFAVMTIAGLLVIGEGLEKTGVVQWVARRLERVVGQSEGRLLLVNTTVPGMRGGLFLHSGHSSALSPAEDQPREDPPPDVHGGPRGSQSHPHRSRAQPRRA